MKVRNRKFFVYKKRRHKPQLWILRFTETRSKPVRDMKGEWISYFHEVARNALPHENN